MQVKIMDDKQNSVIYSARLGSQSPLYPIGYLYSAGGLHYYTANCCVAPFNHSGIIASSVQLATYGCTTNPIENLKEAKNKNGHKTALTEGVVIPNSRLQSNAAGSLIEENWKPELVGPEEFKVTKTDASIGVVVAPPKFRDKTFKFADPNGDALFGNAAFVIKMVIVPGGHLQVLVAHQVINADFPGLLTLSAFREANTGLTLKPHVATLEGEIEALPHWEVLIFSVD
jgi:hypothetical protein